MVHSPLNREQVAALCDVLNQSPDLPRLSEGFIETAYVCECRNCTPIETARLLEYVRRLGLPPVPGFNGDALDRYANMFRNWTARRQAEYDAKVESRLTEKYSPKDASIVLTHSELSQLCERVAKAAVKQKERGALYRISVTGLNRSSLRAGWVCVECAVVGGEDEYSFEMPILPISEAAKLRVGTVLEVRIDSELTALALRPLRPNVPGPAEPDQGLAPGGTDV